LSENDSADGQADEISKAKSVSEENKNDYSKISSSGNSVEKLSESKFI